MKSNLVSTAFFFVAILIAVLGLGAFAASAPLPIAFAIIILWFAGLFMGGRRRANPPAA